MSGKTRAQLQADVRAGETALESLRQAHETLAGALSQSQERAERAGQEVDRLRDELHTAHLTIAHLRGKLSVLDPPDPKVEQAPQPPQLIDMTPPNRWDTPSDYEPSWGDTDPASLGWAPQHGADYSRTRSGGPRVKPWWQRRV